MLGRQLTVTTGLHLRAAVPVVATSGAVTHACSVEELHAGQTVELDGIVKLAYLEDTFYWATVRGRNDKCPPAKD